MIIPEQKNSLVELFERVPSINLPLIEKIIPDYQDIDLQII